MIWKTKAQRNKDKLDILFDRLERLEFLANKTVEFGDVIKQIRRDVELLEKKLNYLYFIDKGMK